MSFFFSHFSSFLRTLAVNLFQIFVPQKVLVHDAKVVALGFARFLGFLRPVPTKGGK